MLEDLTELDLDLKQGSIVVDLGGRVLPLYSHLPCSFRQELAQEKFLSNSSLIVGSTSTAKSFHFTIDCGLISLEEHFNLFLEALEVDLNLRFILATVLLVKQIDLNTQCLQEG